MQHRRLGKTDLEVSVVGFGGGSLSSLPRKRAVEVLNCALDRGVNFFDTARMYGDSEDKLGEILAERREECIVATKTKKVTAKGVMKDLGTSLKRLRTDRVDLIQLHGLLLSDEKNYRRIFGHNGALAALSRAKRSGLVDHIGIALHWSLDLMMEAVESGEFETIMVSYNAIDQEGVGQKILPLARQHDVGVIAMKPLAEGDLTTPGSAGGKVAGFEGIPGRRVVRGDILLQRGLQFILSNPAVATVVPGMTSVEEVEEDTHIGDLPLTLTEGERRELFHTLGGLGRRFNPDGQICLHCGFCLPCPESVDIVGAYRAAEMRHSPLPESVRRRAMNFYRSLKRRPRFCTACRECVSKCPARLPIPDQLAAIARAFEENRVFQFEEREPH